MMTVKERLAALRENMQRHHMDMYLIGSEDFHGSEYVGEYFRCRQWISGFTGSAGTVLVTQDFAGLWTDGRYFLQAEAQLAGTGIELFRAGNEGVPSLTAYMAGHIEEGQCLGFDGRTVGARVGQYYARMLEEKGARVDGRFDLIGEIWQDRPPLSDQAAWRLDLCYSGEPEADKLARVRRQMAEKGADWFVLSSLDDIAWLLNIRGHDVKCNPVVLAYLMMNGDSVRLYTQPHGFKAEDRRHFEELGVVFCPYNAIYHEIGALTDGQTVLYDGASLNYAIVERLHDNVQRLDRENLTLLPKAIKNPTEIENIRRAHVKDGAALTRFMYWLKNHVGKEAMTEMDAAEKLESFRREQEGYLEPSFDPISAYGLHGAIVHYSATAETDMALDAKGMLLMDTGGQYMEGTTDVTRTFVLGEITEEEKFYFTQVLRGQLNLAGARFLYGCRGYNLDYLAREPLWQMGMDYNHGTGHGVGYLLNVHEGPNGFRWRMLPDRNEGCVLEEGMVTSNEPGLYLAGKFGIRHENLMVCMKDEKNEYGQFMRFETLTMAPFDLEGVNPELMTARERQLLNDYHRTVYETVGPLLSEDERKWLAHATRAV